MQSAKYLGVAITQDLDWSTHISKLLVRTNSTMGVLRRNLKASKIKLQDIAYFASVLEYSAVVWDQHLTKNIAALEMAQKRAAWFAKNDYQRTSSVTSMMNDMGWDTLAHRRTKICLMLFLSSSPACGKRPTDRQTTFSPRQTNAHVHHMAYLKLYHRF